MKPNGHLAVATIATILAFHAQRVVAQPRMLALPDQGPGLHFTSITTDGPRVTIKWAGGRGAYQLQVRTNLTGDWRDLGTPTTNTQATAILSSASAYFRIVGDYYARYEVLFETSWSSSTHPGAYPPGAHWSGLVGGTHNERATFWQTGRPASEGIRLMAERGQQTPLVLEVAAAIDVGNAEFALVGNGISGGTGSVRYRFPRDMSRAYPLVTLCSMVAPSPDWFVGVSGLSLIENVEWVNEKVAVLYSHDTGTDSGADFTSPDLLTSPRGVVTQHLGYPARINGRVTPFGTFTFRRLN